MKDSLDKCSIGYASGLTMLDRSLTLTDAVIRFRKALDERILVLDGAMGTMIQSYPLKREDFRGAVFGGSDGTDGTIRGVNDLLCLTRPDVIEDIHRRYLEAGADIIETNTFNATSVSLRDFRVEDCCRAINFQAARIARRVADSFTDMNPKKPRFVVGSVGPTGKRCLMNVDDGCGCDDSTVSFEVLCAAYCEQMEALLEGGVDGFLVETIVCIENARAAILAAEHIMGRVGKRVPLMLSLTISNDGCLLSGQTIEEFLIAVQEYDVFSVGLNCSYGARQIGPVLKRLSQQVPYYISAYPNAGLPDSSGKYTETPAMMAQEMNRFVDEGLVNIVGGCCGTTPIIYSRVC